MLVKVATWNMGHWQHRAKLDEAWKYLDETVAPDIALVQEAVPLSKNRGFVGKATSTEASLVDTECVVWREIGGRRKWGSGVLTRNLPLREVFVPNAYPGAVVTTEVLLPDETILTVISLYGQMDHKRYAITTLHRMFSDLTHLLEGLMGKKRRIIIGGDFNASLQFDEHYKTDTHRIFFERTKAFGLVDPLAGQDEKALHTLRRHNSEVPWRNDYILVSKNLKKKVKEAYVVQTESMFELSDHNPVVVTLEL